MIPNRFIRFVLWISRYHTGFITVGKDVGYGETMVVIGKRPAKEKL